MKVKTRQNYIYSWKNIKHIHLYEINLWDRGYDDCPTDKYKYSEYGIGFDRRGTFSVGNGFGKNLINFGVDISSAVHVDNKKKVILILGEGPSKGLDDTTLTAEKSIQSILLSLKRNFV